MTHTLPQLRFHQFVLWVPKAVYTSPAHSACHYVMSAQMYSAQSSDLGPGHYSHSTLNTLLSWSVAWSVVRIHYSNPLLLTRGGRNHVRVLAYNLNEVLVLPLQLSSLAFLGSVLILSVLFSTRYCCLELQRCAMPVY